MHQPTDSNWREASRCAEVDPEVFFPAVGANANAARRICAACPVRVDCLAAALNTRDIAFGVRGGLTPTQRRALLNHRTGRAA
jgi:WhiB family redox-sensing transcriptional regulator